MTTVRMSDPALLFLLLFLLRCSTAMIHDDSFTPDAILHVNMQNISVGGINRLTTLVNGSLPGPELRFSEGQPVWVRVYNRMEENNLTMVSLSARSLRVLD